MNYMRLINGQLTLYQSMNHSVTIGSPHIIILSTICMRTANQKWKLSTALKNMNDNHQQQSLYVEQKDLKVPTLAIINIDSCTHQPIKKTQRKPKNIMFCTLKGSHKKQKGKGLKSFFESTGIKIAAEQKSKSTSKSERNKPVIIKNTSRFSQRLISASKLMKQTSQQSTQMLNQMRSRADSIDQIELQSFKKNSSFNLHKANEILIKEEDSHLKVQGGNTCDLAELQSQNRKSLTEPSVFLDNSSIMMQQLMKWQKEEALLKFKKSLKNKQSRKHIHRVLRQTSQTTSKYKTQSKHLQISKDVFQPSGILEVENLSPLHSGLTKKNIKHFCLNSLKRINSIFVDDQQDLKIQAKAAKLVDMLSKQSQEGALRHIYENRVDRQKFKATTQKFKATTQSCFEIKQYDLKALDRSYVKKRWVAGKQKQMHHFSADKYRSNVFRELTPWHEDEPE